MNHSRTPRFTRLAVLAALTLIILACTCGPLSRLTAGSTPESAEIEPEALPDSFLADLVHVQRRSLFNKIVMTREISAFARLSEMPAPESAGGIGVSGAFLETASLGRAEVRPMRPRIGENVA